MTGPCHNPRGVAGNWKPSKLKDSDFHGNSRMVQLHLTPEELARRIARMKAEAESKPVVKPSSKVTKTYPNGKAHGSKVPIPLAEQMKNYKPVQRFVPRETRKSKLEDLKKHEQWKPTDWFAHRGKRHK